ncbi:plasmid mobilization protein [Rhodomicrobium lacus]|uniref:plasmid mobilization protein n=1 Tax=Rhodomicrobium lacus TaxID=2498452 RepID=UPI000F8E5E69|nr:DUF1778 domain-containing protein [Rhodomicrobium lacus]
MAKEVSILIRCSAEDKETLKAVAARKGLTLSAYMLSLAIENAESYLRERGIPRVSSVDVTVDEGTPPDGDKK